MATIRLIGLDEYLALDTIFTHLYWPLPRPATLDIAKSHLYLLTGVSPSIPEVGGQAVLGRQNILPTPWLTERHGYDPTYRS